MTPWIKSLTVRDFRSIRGSITIPLDAPIILVHGRNGAGKTSLLSALELGLTGSLSSLDRLDTNLREHLVHKQAKDASVSICVDGLDAQPSDTKLHISDNKIVGKGLLGQSHQTHYSERCYLAQSTLSRLLEIYQAKPSTASASPLTRFVKEILGLDALDALIDGLHDAGDVRRLRSGAVRYWEVREQLPTLDAELDRLNKELAAGVKQEQELANAIRSLLTPHWPNDVDRPIQSMFDFLYEKSQEVELQHLVKLRREITDTLAQWQSTELSTAVEQREIAETDAAAAAQALQQWIDSSGRLLTTIFQELSSFFPDLPSPIQNRPEYARTFVLKAVTTELERCQQILARDTELRNRVDSIEQDRQTTDARLVVLDQQIAQESQEAGQLAQALSAIIPHIHSEDCPVCSRNFSEVSDSPLLGHLSGRVAALTQSAGRLTALSNERADTLGLIMARSRELASVQALLLAETPKQEFALRMAKLREASAALDDIGSEAQRGEELFVGAANTAKELAALRARDQQSTSIRESANRFSQILSLEPIGPNEPLRVALDRFMAYVQAEEVRLTAKESDRHKAEAMLRELILKQQAVEQVSLRLNQRQNDHRTMRTALAAGDRAIDQARELLKVAQTERAQIVSRVFNESLNAAWRDLFVRLAPDEPFVPAFALPSSGRGNAEAKLETHYRNGGKGGNPRAMLSAGNLNTAALTLFLALHLSVKSPLPWLVIDDPVQSMDEVHISQFAALLRTLAKQHGRQVVIAVHEKPLFDYLCLELSPAFKGDRLITVELGRAPDGNSIGICNVKEWKPDLVIAA